MTSLALCYDFIFPYKTSALRPKIEDNKIFPCYCNALKNSVVMRIMKRT